VAQPLRPPSNVLVSGLGDPEESCALECVGEDLQSRDLLAPIAPDVHDRKSRRPLPFGQVGMAKHDDRVALLDELDRPG